MAATLISACRSGKAGGATQTGAEKYSPV